MKVGVIMNYICRKATREDIVNRWQYLLDIYSGDNSWVVYRDNTLKNFDEGNIIVYYGLLDNRIICEMCAYIKEEAFIGDIEEPSGLLNQNMAYLAAFRTNKEFEGCGYFSKLYKFAEDNLKALGYTELSLGVGPEAVRNIEIYFHLGYRDYIKTTIEHEPPKNEDDIPEDEFVNFYKKHL